MSTFVQVNSIKPKNAPLIINLDHVIEIVPLLTGGCLITFSAQEGGGLRTVTVEDDFSAFQQFAMQTVTADSIAGKLPKGIRKEKISVAADVVKPQEEGKNVELSIPTFGMGTTTKSLG